MGKIRRGNFIFKTSIGDHDPRHVHVYRDSQLVVKWDLEGDRPLAGTASARLVDLIRQLKAEGKL